MSGERKEHIVETRLTQRERCRGDAFRLENPQCFGDDARAVVHVDLHRAAVHDRGLFVHRLERLRGSKRGPLVDKTEVENSHAHVRLQGGRSSSRDDLAVVDDHQVLGEPVGLLQVLGREEYCRALCDETFDHGPHIRTARRVQAGGRLVEKEHSRVGNKRGGDVKASAHPSGVRLGRPVRRVSEAELFEKRRRALLELRFGHVVEPSDHPEVLRAGKVLVDCRELTGEPDQRAHYIRLGRDIVTEHPGHPAVGLEHSRENPNGGGLARPVRAEQPEDRALFHAEADSVEGPHSMAEGLVQVLQLDGQRHG